MNIEESYTTDLIAAEDREKSLRNRLIQLEDSNRAQNELIQQLNTIGEQSKQTLATELGTLKYEYTKLNELNQNLNHQLQYQMKCSQNLQNVLEQFKRGKNPFEFRTNRIENKVYSIFLQKRTDPYKNLFWPLFVFQYKPN